MNIHGRWMLILAGVLLTLGLSYGQKNDSAETLLQSGIKKEVVDGDLKGAIEIYKQAVARGGSNRAITAQALVQMGKAYEKLGAAEAKDAYSRVLREYSDQQEMAAEARARLAVIERHSPAAPAAEPQGVVLRQVWTPPALPQPNGSVSPDGKLLAFRDPVTGDAAIRDPAAGQTRRITQAKQPAPDQPWIETAYSPLISPDGNSIIYTWCSRTPDGPSSACEIRMAAIDGSQSRTVYNDPIYDNGTALSWSSDGRQIVALIGNSAQKGASDQSKLVLMSVADGSVRTLRSFTERWVPGTTFSPDSRYLVCDRQTTPGSDSRDIFVLSADGSGEWPLVEHPASDRLIGWIPNTNEILFMSDRSGTVDAWLIEVADGRPKGQPRMVKRNLGWVVPWGITKDGSFYFGLSELKNTVQIARIDPATGQRMDQTTETILGSNHSPAWSPDGSSMVYVFSNMRINDPLFGRHVLRIRDLETGKERDLAAEPIQLSNTADPRWSPNGRSILVRGVRPASTKEARQAGLYRIDLEDGKAMLLAPPSSSGEWSPDGKAVYFLNLEEGYIGRRELASGRDEKLNRSPSLVGTWKFDVSPDGRNLIFGTIQRDKGISSLMLMSTSGGDARELVNVGTDGITATWSPDGKHVYYMRYRGQRSTLWRIVPEGGTPEKLWQLEQQVLGFSFHPHGDRIAFFSQEMASEIWAMEKFR